MVLFEQLTFLILSIILLIFILSWPKRKKQAGSLLINLRRNEYQDYWWWFYILCIPFLLYKLIKDVSNIRFIIIGICAILLMIFLGLSGYNGIKITENGFLRFERLIRWDKIKSFNWVGNRKNKLKIRIKTWNILLSRYYVIIYEDLKDQVNSILYQKIILKK